jgi:hypothetical protein
VKNSSLSVKFKIIAPDSIYVFKHTDRPYAIGTENPSGTSMGALTYYDITLSPTTVSYGDTQIRERLAPFFVTNPNGTISGIIAVGATNGVIFSCYGGGDNIEAGLRPVSLLWNGTNYADFSYTYNWQGPFQ